MRIDVFTLGGTISSSKTGADGAAPTLSGAEVLSGIHVSGVELVIHDLPPRPSSWISISDLCSLAVAIDTAASDGAEAVLVVQGTDTLEEAGFILELARRSRIPIALTGAMRTPDAIGADGPANIKGALAYLRVAAPSTSAVVLDDEVHPARHVRKTHTTSLNAFQSHPFGPLGLLIEGEYRSYREPEPPVSDLQGIIRTHPAKVLLAQWAIGEDFAWLPSAMEYHDALVVAGAGAAHVSADAARNIVDVAAGKATVAVSRTLTAALPRATYDYQGSESFLSAHGVLISGGLDGLRARILLALTADADVAETKRRYRAIEARLVPGLAEHHGNSQAMP